VKRPGRDYSTFTGRTHGPWAAFLIEISPPGNSEIVSEDVQVKIVFIIDSLRRHGAQRVLVDLARGLGQIGYTQNVIVLNDACEPDVEQALNSASCTITHIGKVALLLGGAGWWRVFAILRWSKPDVVMTMLPFADTLGRPAARLARCRSIVTSIQSRNPIKPSWQRWLDRRTIRWADKVIFNAPQVVGFVRRREGVRDDQVEVIPNGVEDVRARSGFLRNDSRKQLGISSETVALGAVARFYPQKNLPLLLHTASKLSITQQWKLLLLGDGPERANLITLGRELGLTDRLIWLGARTDVGPWLAAMDIFVHTADFEGMPIAVMEAMAMGLPVVASQVDGTQELIRDSMNGYLVRPGDADGFAKRIHQLVRDPGLARRLGEEAHRDVLDRFGLERMIGDYHRLFQSLV
jgi:glycosyltransferase involved in cell wall biosynthesis